MTRVPPWRRKLPGQTLVELSILLPLFVVIVAVLIDLALIANAQMTLHRLTAAVSAEATQYRDGRYPTEGEVRSELASRLLPPLSRDRLTIEEARIETDAAGRRWIQLAVHYDVPLFTPGLSLFFASSSARISSSDRSTYPEPSTRPPVAVAAAPFRILPGGDIELQSNASARVKVLSKRFRTESGNDVPITLELADDGRRFSPGFGANPVSGGEEMTLSDLSPGKKVALKATARLRGAERFDASYASNEQTPFADNDTFFHQYVLGRNDSTPDHAAFSGPPALGPELAPFVDTASRTMKLRRKDVAVLWEFNPRHSSPGTDFQDVIVLVQFYDPAQERRPVTP